MEETCQAKDLSKILQSFKDKFTTNTNNKPIDSIGSTIETYLTTFRNAYSNANNLGTVPSPTLHANVANILLQMHSIKASRELQGLEGASTRSFKLRELVLIKGTLGAFLVSKSYILDTWLVDTRVNIHIVNDIKQFKKEIFHLFKDCLVDISTTNRSTTL